MPDNNAILAELKKGAAALAVARGDIKPQAANAFNAAGANGIKASAPKKVASQQHKM